MFAVAYLGLGSNSPDKISRLDAAAEAIGRLPGVRISALSSLYLTEPQDVVDQPWFANRVAEARASAAWTPQAFLGALLGIEAALGRVREGAVRRGPRAIDIDLLTFGDAKTEGAFCALPHPRLFQRAFVLVPLMELNPDLLVGGRSIRDALRALVWRKSGRRLYQGGPRHNICLRD